MKNKRKRIRKKKTKKRYVFDCFGNSNLQIDSPETKPFFLFMLVGDDSWAHRKSTRPHYSVFMCICLMCAYAELFYCLYFRREYKRGCCHNGEETGKMTWRKMEKKKMRNDDQNREEKQTEKENKEKICI